jgi:hypothetical protein
MSEIYNSLRPNFEKDKKYLFEEVKNYLNNESKNSQTYQQIRSEAAQKIKSGNIIEAINDLEDARDVKRGIITFRTKNSDNKTPILIRDARNCKKGISEGIEAAEIIVLAVFEAAKDILMFDKNSKNNSDFLQKDLQKMAIDFFENFAAENEEKSDKELFRKSNIEMSKIGKFLTKCGVKNAKEKITQALHFQNFKQDENYNPVTISNIIDEKGNQHTFVEANVAFKGLSNEQKKLYNKIIDEKAVSELQISLMEENKDKFFSGKYVIPTQLINTVPGIRNAFEELNFIVQNSNQKNNIVENDLELIDVRKRVGALPTIINKNKKLTKEITESNARQAVILNDDNQTKLHWNLLNTDMPIVGQSFGGYETDIVRNTREATKNNYINFSVTPLNRFRRVGITSDLKDIKDYLNTFANSLTNEDLKIDIKPKSFFDKFKFHKQENNFDDIISEIKNKNPNSDFAKIIKLAKKVKEHVDDASTAIRINDGFDKENVSLKISTKFSRLTELVNQAFRNKKSDLFEHCDKGKIPLENVAISCKSAKDRTGLSMFYRMAKILEDKIEVGFNKICDTLHSSGHMEYLPGSFRVGGGTPGCYQLQSPVLSALPESEKDFLKVIIGPFAHNNKGPKPKLFDKIKDYFFEKKIAFLDKFDGKFEEVESNNSKPLLQEEENLEKTTSKVNEIENIKRTSITNATAKKFFEEQELQKNNSRQ